MNKENWISKYFTPDEFECNCGCQTLNVSKTFIEQLDEARGYAEKLYKNNCSFIPTSGCRCLDHNRNIGGKEKSLHRTSSSLVCTAVDLSITDDHKRAIVLLSLAAAGFTHIGIGSNFIHVDESPKTGVWLY